MENNTFKPVGRDVKKIVAHSHKKKQIRKPAVFVWKPPKGQFDSTRALSWSQLSCFENPDYPEYSDPEKWYQRYVLGIQDAPTPQLLFGSKIDKLIQKDRSFLPELERFPDMQFKMDPIYKGIKLVGFADQWDITGIRLADDKTGVKPWDQKRADKTGQITMYCLMIYLMQIATPEKVNCSIRWIPTVQNADMSIALAKPVGFQIFHTRRTMADIMKFAHYIETTRNKMIEYAKNHK